jgi:hypothetical protein
MTIDSAFEAEIPSGGQGGEGAVGPSQKNCPKTCPPASAGEAGIGMGFWAAPTELLMTSPGTRKLPTGLIHTWMPRMGRGEARGRRLK